MTPSQREKLTAAFGKHLQCQATLTIEAGPLTAETPAQRDLRRESVQNDAAIASLESDPNVQAFKDAFGATVESDSVKRL